MSLECSECERTLRGGHDESCSRYDPALEACTCDPEREPGCPVHGVTLSNQIAAIREQEEHVKDDDEGTKRIHPGSRIKHIPTGDERIILGRKEGDDAQPHPGWWLTDGSGLADFVLAREWQVLS